MKSRKHLRCALGIAATALAGCGLAALGLLPVRAAGPAFAPGTQASFGAAGPAAIAIIAVDAADWQTIDPLIAAGRLPAFAALKAAGGVGTMRPEPPLLSPIIWTTIATGRRPEDHGVLDFMVDQAGGPMPVSGGARRTKALWEIFSDAGRPVLVSGWWATWPADRVRGVVVSDRVAVPHLRLDPTDVGLVHPAERLRDVATARVEPEAIDYQTLNQFVGLTQKAFDEAVAEARAPAGLYRNRFAHARAALAATRTYGAVTTKLLPTVRPAFLAVYFDLVDTMSHLFVQDPQRRDRAIGSAYAEVDRQISAIARSLDPETFVLVMSDHGFYRADAGIPDDPSDLTSGAAAWHRPYGIVAATTAGALAGTRAAPRLAALGNVSPLDIAPAVLARAELPVARDMPGRALPTLAGGASVTTTASYGAHQLPEQTLGDSRNNINTTTRAAELERLRALGYVSGRSAVTTLARVNLGEILYRKGAFKEAIVQLEAAVAADRANQRAGLWLARAYSAAGRPDDAARTYDRLLQSAATGAIVDPLVVIAVTDLDVARGQTTAAANRLSRLPAQLSRLPETQLARGAIADAEGKPLEAERLFRGAYSGQPTNIDALSRLVDLLIRGSRGAAAAQVAADAARRFPDSPERLALVGESALAERRIADAVRAFRQALALAPDAASVRVELGRAELLQNHADAALEAVGDLSGHDAEVVRGAAFSSKRNWPAAVGAYTRAAVEGPPAIDLLNALGNAQLEAGRPADAVTTFERSLSLKADQPAIRALLDRARAQASAPRPRS